MTDPVDKSLLDRLQALRGGSSSSSVRNTPTKISIDPIERKRTPTREEALAARLKSLRDADFTPPPAKSSPAANKPSAAPAQPSASPAPVKPAQPDRPASPGEEDDIDAAFQTDDHLLEELLGDVGPDEGFHLEPSDAQVKALLDELADSIPKDVDDDAKPAASEGEGEGEIDPDDSDDEGMKREVDDVLARFRDELEIERAHAKDDDDDEQPPPTEAETQDAHDDDDGSKPLPSIEGGHSPFSLPDLPSDLADLPPPERTARAASTDLDDLTARMAALRSSGTPNDAADVLDLPDVPTGAPSKPRGGRSGFKRLTSRTNYTDDDVDSWCTVCLEDATLRCLGCDDDVYCARCWREMHIGPQASFDDRSHRAVQFTRDKKQEKRKVAVGAS